MLAPLGFLFASFSPVQESVPATVPTTAKSVVRVHVVSMHHDTTWFDDRFGHAVGKEVECGVYGTLNTGVTLKFASVEGRKTSGCSVTVKLAKGTNKTTVADVYGDWWMDCGKAPRRGQLQEIDCDLYLSDEFINPYDLGVKFSLRAKVPYSDVILLGGTKFVVPFK